ncbi:hypothetical protein SISNIDRAFT_486742 [Sistotremastrum niveocremeum HHB9708]|uniref:F-box domain-containing protein n=1 Tax=Sistotremastrum niveocremeum HHB9708 TaxID=1314777 RepID=A0A164TAG5_9AGAM|nr:hypothetical protein SISNIDRAFT_486742 [Sistotremastrum niveocremeum HHB9708]
MGKSRSKKVNASQRKATRVKEDPGAKALLRLPLNIVQRIVEEIVLQVSNIKEYRRQLAILARSSRQLQAEAERRLYERLTFPVGATSAVTIVKTLRSRTAPYVQHLLIQGYGVRWTHKISTFRTATALPFNLMTSLKSLNVFSHDSDADKFQTTADVDPELFVQLEKELPTDTLRHFGSSLPLTIPSLRFLGKQSNLEVLIINCFEDRDISQESLKVLKAHPRLREIHARQMNHVVSSIMEGAPDVQLLTISLEFWSPFNWDSCAQNLIKLDIMDSYPDKRVLREIVKASPLLRFLMFTVGQEWELFEDDVFDVLRDLKRLSTLGLSIDIGDKALQDLIGNCTKCKPLEVLLFKVGNRGIELSREPEGQRVNEARWGAVTFDKLNFPQWIAEQDLRIAALQS